MLEEKAALRREKLAARRRLTKAERDEKSERIKAALMNLPEVRRAKSFFVYVAMEDEAATLGILKRLLDDKKCVTVPLITGKGLMEAARLSSIDALAPGDYGIPTANENGRETVSPELLDCALIPGTAFSREGARLGMGGGYYDAFLPRAKNAIRIALAFSCQLSENVPSEPHDAGVDIIVTEDEVIHCGQRKKY